MSVEMKHGRHKEIDPKGRRIVIFVGPEGSGKSTQGKLLAEKLNLPYVSSGDIIRDMAKNDSGRLGGAARKMIKEHAYLDPRLISEIIANRFSLPDAADGVVMDGALRTLEETENFDETLSLAGKEDFEVDVIFLGIDKEEGIKRRLESDDRREGETRESILIRLDHFSKDLEERMEIAKKRYRFFKIDASPTIDEVYKEILTTLNI